RTEKLSPVTPMVLRNSGRVGSRRFFLKDPLATRNTGARGFSRLFCMYRRFSYLCGINFY
ncbi:hypothetical protein, partial [Bacteroides salyersiae]|uniref:hypothetical protein n=1 Tax=Bacteroides salyersiae TaxID=291644 RepID=UPI001961BB02